jgi:hypothetical protein
VFRSGRYDFKGIKRLGALGLFNLLQSSPLGFLASGVAGKFFFTLFEFIANYAANRGLIFLNVTISNAQTDSQQREYVEIVDWALKEVRPDMSQEEMKEIDDKVIQKLVAFAVLTSK